MTSLLTKSASRFFVWERAVLFFIFLIQYRVTAQDNGNFTNGGRFWLVKAGQSQSGTTLSSVQLASNGNNSIVNVSNFPNGYTGPIGLYVPVTNTFARVTFTFQGVTTNDTTNIYSMGPGGNINNGNNFQAVPSFRVNGVKNILVQGINSTNNVMSIFNLQFTVVGGMSAPTAAPSAKPSSKPSAKPSAKPSSKPSSKPSLRPSSQPSQKPSARPVPPTPPITVITASPSAKPSASPSAKPSLRPTSSLEPSSRPSAKPSSKPSSKPSQRPSSRPTGELLPVYDALKNGKWIVTDNNATLTGNGRHENCFVMVDRMAVLIVGRNSSKNPVTIYDPVTRTWRAGSYQPNRVELHHTQCMVINKKIWIVAAWTKNYPREETAPYIYIYDPYADTWETRPPPPGNRVRGSTANIAVGTDIYVAFGNIGGHYTLTWTVPKSYTWMDKYDTITGQWTSLASGYYPRDHVGGGYINGLICVGGGRDGGVYKWPRIPQTECYNITANTWTIMPNLTVPRGGAAYGTFNCPGYKDGLILAGGEVQPNAIADTDLFNGTHWITLPKLNIPRHSSGIAVDCECRALYVASGAGKAGSIPIVTAVETYFWDGVDTPCLK